MAIEQVESLDFLQDVLSSGKQRGLYDGQIKEFLDSGISGGRVDLTAGIFQGKKAQTVKTGLTGAIERLGKLPAEERPANLDQVEIRVKEDKVYVIRKDLVYAAEAAA